MNIERDNVEACSAYKDGVLTISIMGSGEFKERPLSRNDWIVTNFRARPVRHRNWVFHRGFLEAWYSIEPLVFQEIERHEPEVIILRGHSMGGAVSGVGAAILSDFYPIVKHTSYGGPRFLWGWRSRARFNERVESIRHVNGLDIVPHVPPWWWGYLHGGEAIKWPRPFRGLLDFVRHHDFARYGFTPCPRHEL